MDRMNQSMKKAQIESFFATLKAANPQPNTELEYTSVFELLTAVLLSAQATDVGVNKATRRLFVVANTPQAIVKLGLPSLMSYIQTIGLYRNKAKHLMQTCEILLAQHQGQVPRDREALEALPGVGRKTANVVLGHAYGIPGITVDTHFGRLSRRFGWSKNQNPVKVETDVSKLIAEKEWTNLSQRLIWHGRRVCFARNPACGACVLKSICPSFGIGIKDEKVAKTKVKSEADFK